MLKGYIKKYVWLQYTTRIIYNFFSTLLKTLGKITSDSGTIHSNLSVDESIAYINDVFDDYKNYAGISHFHGRVCELGPGDNSGVALNILAEGADAVDLADRFYCNRSAANQAKIYHALANKNHKIRILLKNASFDDETTFSNMKRYYGPSAAGELFFKNRIGTYDFIISRSVMEHVTHPLLVLESMYNALKPGGYLIHKVDLRDHGMFTPQHHDLKFLEIPSSVYLAMTYNSGLPNRVLINRYKDRASFLPGTCKFLITQLAYTGAITPHTPFDKIPHELLQKSLTGLKEHKKNLSHAFQKYKDTDLIVSGFFMILQKPNE